MAKYEVRWYRYADGSGPAKIFLDGMPEKPRGKALRWIEMLADLGPDLQRPYADIVRGKIRELRVSYFRSEYRMLYFFDERFIVVTNGFVKKTDSVPVSEIAKAENMMNDYFVRKKLGGFKT